MRPERDLAGVTRKNASVDERCDPAGRGPDPGGGRVTRTARRSALAAMLRRRCPRCREGRVFAGPLRMNETCPVCGLKFGRGEPGYFTGAMYVSYALAIPLIGLVTLVEYLILPRMALWQLVLLAWALCVIAVAAKAW